MVRRLASIFVLVLGGGSGVLGQEWARKMFETRTHDFGTVARHAKAEYRFELSNLYLDEVRVKSARPSCGCTSVKIEKPLLKTYEKGAIIAVLNTKSYLGQRRVTVTVTFDQPSLATVQLQVTGNIRGEVTVQPGAVLLGTVDRGTPVEKTFSVSRTGRSSWRVLEVQSANPHLSAEVVDATYDSGRVSCRVRVRLSPEVPVGMIRDHLVLVTNDARSKSIPVLVEGQVAGGLAVFPSSLFMGVLEPGQKVTRKIVVRGKRPFRVTSVSGDNDRFELTSSISDVAQPMHVIPLTFVAGNQPGKVVQTIRIETDLDEAPPELVTYAVVKR